MGDESHIEWTDATWTIVQGCDYCSSGCAHCYATKEIVRQAGSSNPKLSLPVLGLVEKDGQGRLRWTGKIACREDRLDWPLRWTRPRKIFVPSLGDLFYGDDDDRRRQEKRERAFTPVPFEFIDKVFAVAALCPQHTFQILTKRVERMEEYLDDRGLKAESEYPDADYRSRPGHPQERIRDVALTMCSSRHPVPSLFDWPLPNVWLGCSIEDQANAQKRLPALRRLRQAGWTTFVSYEPALGPVDWAAVGKGAFDWLIAGGESGAGARPAHPAWFRAARDFCGEQGVAFHFKQWGAWAPKGNFAGIAEWSRANAFAVVNQDGRHSVVSEDEPDEEFGLRACDLDGNDGAAAMAFVGKKAAGRLLDGRTWDELPAAVKAEA